MTRKIALKTMSRDQTLLETVVTCVVWRLLQNQTRRITKLRTREYIGSRIACCFASCTLSRKFSPQPCQESWSECSKLVAPSHVTSNASALSCSFVLPFFPHRQLFLYNFILLRGIVTDGPRTLYSPLYLQSVTLSPPPTTWKAVKNLHTRAARVNTEASSRCAMVYWFA
jgi:hypothetical protein